MAVRGGRERSVGADARLRGESGRDAPPPRGEYRDRAPGAVRDLLYRRPCGTNRAGVCPSALRDRSATHRNF
jgi:hypothetical protein